MGEKKNTSKNQPPPSEEEEYETRTEEGQENGEKVKEVVEPSGKETAAWHAKQREKKSEKPSAPKPKEQPKPEEKPKEEIFAEAPPSNLEKRCAQLKKKLEEFLKKADWTATEEAGKLRQETNDFYTLLTGKFKTKPGAEEEKKLHSVWGKISAVVGKFKKKCREAGLEVEEIEKKEEVSKEAPPPQKEKVASLEELAEQEKKRKKEEKKEKEERKKIKVEVEGKIDVFFQKEAAGKPPEISPAGPPPPEGLPGGTTPEKQPTPEAKKTPSEAIETHLRDLLNQTKILETFKDRKAECDKALDQRKFAFSENLYSEKLLKEKQATSETIDYLMKNTGKELDEKGEKEFKQKIEDLASQIGFTKEEEKAKIKEAIQQIELQKQERVQQEILAAKKPDLKSSLLRAGLYGAIGTAMYYSGASKFGGLVLAGLRTYGLVSQEVKERTALKNEYDQHFNALQIRLEKGEDEGSVELQKNFSQNLASLIAMAKQGQIDGTFKQEAGVVEELQKTETAYLKDYKESKGKTKRTGENFKKFDKARKEVSGVLVERFKFLVKDSPQFSHLSEEQKAALWCGVQALRKLDDEDTLFEQELEQKDPTTWEKFEKKVTEVIKHPWLGWLRGGTTKPEQVMTTVITGAAGYLSREIPVVREMLFGYAGMRAGGLLADLAVVKWGDKLIKGITEDEMKEMAKEDNPSDEFIYRAKIQLNDANFKKAKPAEVARLREIVDKAQQKKLKCAEQALEFAENHSTQLENTYAKKRDLERGAKILKVSGRVLGAIGGVLLGRELMELAAAKAQAAEATKEVMPVAPPVVEKPVISDVLTAHKGDTVWGLIEKQLGSHYGDKFTNLKEAQETYIIDALKDKVVANPGAYGLKDAHHLVSGEKVDLTSLFRDETGLLKIFGKATHLTQDQVQNILDNNYLLRHVARTPLEDLSQYDLQRTIDIMGGHDLAPSSYVQALEQRLAGEGIEEVLRELTPADIKAREMFTNEMYDAFRNLGLSNFALDHHSIIEKGTGTFFLVDPQYNEVPVAIKDWQVEKIGDLFIDPPIKLAPDEPLPALLRGEFLEQLWNARLAEAGIAQNKIWDIYDAAQNWMPKDLRGLPESALADLKPDQLGALKSLAHFEAQKDKFNLLLDGHRWNSAEDFLGQIKKETSGFLSSPDAIWADRGRVNKWFGKAEELMQLKRELYPFPGADKLTVDAANKILAGTDYPWQFEELAAASPQELGKFQSHVNTLIEKFGAAFKESGGEETKRTVQWLKKLAGIITARRELVR